MTFKVFNNLKDVEKEYLEQAIQEAKKNTNIFNEDCCYIHQFKFDYVNFPNSLHKP